MGDSDDRGMVTAETAILLPGLVFVLAGALWVVAAVGGQLRCLDAAREGARLAARGEPDATAVAAAAVRRPPARLCRSSAAAV